MKHPALLHAQRGVTMLMVMLLMTALLLGALAFARVTEAGALVSGNLATKEAAMHAAEVGRGVAFAQLQALANTSADTGTWYRATQQPTDAATGVPTTINFDAAPAVTGGVGRFKVNYAIDRLCNVNTVTDSNLQCLVMHKLPGNDTVGDSEDMGYERKNYMSKGPRQYRITVRVTDDRGTQTFTQSLVTVN